MAMSEEAVREAEKQMIITFVNIIRGVIRVAVEKSPADAVSMVGNYIEECGVEREDTEMRSWLDAWWAGQEPPKEDAA